MEKDNFLWFPCYDSKESLLWPPSSFLIVWAENCIHLLLQVQLKTACQYRNSAAMFKNEPDFKKVPRLTSYHSKDCGEGVVDTGNQTGVI